MGFLLAARRDLSLAYNLASGHSFVICQKVQDKLFMQLHNDEEYNKQRG